MNNKRISRIQEFIQMALKIKQICTELTLRQAYYSSAPSKFHWDRQIDEADSTELILEVRVEPCKSESAIYTGLRQTLQGINWPNSLAHIKHQKWAILQEREKSKRSAHVRKIQNSKFRPEVQHLCDASFWDPMYTTNQQPGSTYSSVLVPIITIFTEENSESPRVHTFEVCTDRVRRREGVT